MTFLQEHWFLKDLQYEYLDDGFKLIATTDVPCHLFARMTTTPPRKHALPSYRRGLYLQGDIRFCFVVYEDNEQDEAGDTLTHTWHKSAWPVCETRWFYFVGTILGLPVVSESPIFKFHFPAPPPEPPPPIDRYFFARPTNRPLWYSHAVWLMARDTLNGFIDPRWADPPATLFAATTLTASYFVRRAFTSFDTSIMPATAQILAAELLIYVTGWIMTSSAAFPYLYLQQGFQSDPIVPGDYGEQRLHGQFIGKTRYDSLIVGQYCPVPFDTANLFQINLAGITKLALRGEMDVVNIAPPLGSNEVTFHSEQKGVAHCPTLHVQYNPAT